ncbi:uncharacterized protein [Antedon mediterranea]|uniref:uncharacterized protein n=1 Tax=Antedon mediterranea TaxID=105859 RepID=UPI003AF42ECE
MLASTVPTYLSYPKLLPHFIDGGSFMKSVPMHVSLWHYHQDIGQPTACQYVSTGNISAVDEKVSNKTTPKSTRKTSESDDGVTNNEKDTMETDSANTPSRQTTIGKLSFGIDRILQGSSGSENRAKKKSCGPSEKPQNNKAKYPLIHREKTSTNKESSPNHQESSAIRRRETSSVDQESSAIHREPSSIYREPSSSHRESSPIHRESSSNHREPSSIHRESSPIHRDPSSIYQEPSSIHRESHPIHRETSSIYREPTFHREISLVHRDSSTIHREPSVSHHIFDKPAEFSWETYGNSMKHQQMNFQQIWLPPTLRNDHAMALDRVCLCSACLGGSSLKPRSLWQAVNQQPSSSHFAGAVKRKRSWSRAVFTSLQRKGLEKRFDVQKYVNKPDRRQLAAALGLTDAQVKVWFQNRRMKWRQNQKQTKDNSCQISTGGNVDKSSATTDAQDELSNSNITDDKC